MLDQTKLKLYRFLSAILLVALFGMSGVMYVSAHGGDGTLIHACVNNRNGTVRIVGASATCDTSKETALDWGIQGLKGDKGDTGDVGPMGPQGPAGGNVGFYNRSTLVELPVSTETSGQAYCDPGDYAIAGGTTGVFGGSGMVYMTSNGPIDHPIDEQVHGWEASLYNQSPDYHATFVHVVCADITP